MGHILVRPDVSTFDCAQRAWEMMLKAMSTDGPNVLWTAQSADDILDWMRVLCVWSFSCVRGWVLRV